MAPASRITRTTTLLRQSVLVSHSDRFRGGLTVKSPTLVLRCGSSKISRQVCYDLREARFWAAYRRSSNLRGLISIGGSTAGNQAESAVPCFVDKLMQLGASAFCISRFDLDLA